MTNDREKSDRLVVPRKPPNNAGTGSGGARGHLVLRRRLHESIPEQGAYLRSVLLGHVRYYGVPRNGASLMAFRSALGRVWRAMLRRSQTARVTWARIARLTARWLPIPHICHPHLDQRLEWLTKVGPGCGNSARPGSVEGVISDGHCYSDR